MEKKISQAEVLEFLRQSGFKSAEKALLEELNQKSQTEEARVEEFLTRNANYTSTVEQDSFQSVYEKLLQFISMSPEEDKMELSAVLFPVFVIIFVGQVERSSYKEAKEFFDRFRSAQDDYYQDVLETLATINSPDSLRTNVSVLQFAGESYVITMVRHAYHRIMHFIQQPNLQLLKIILTNIVRLKEVDGPSRSRALRSAGQGYVFGDVGFEANRKFMFYGLLKFPDVEKMLSTTVVHTEDEDASNVGGGSKKKRRKDGGSASSPGKASGSSAAGGSGSGGNTIPNIDRVPLPPLRERDKQFMCTRATEIASDSIHLLSILPPLTESQGRGGTGGGKSSGAGGTSSGTSSSEGRRPLSAVMFTVQSSGPKNREVTCMTFSEDCSLLVFAVSPRHCIIVHSTKTSCITMSSGTGPLPPSSSNTSLMESGLVQLKSVEELNRLNPSDLNVMTSALKDSGDPYRVFIGHSARVYQVSLAPNKETLLSCSADGTVRYWSLLTWSCLYNFDCSSMLIGGATPMSNPAYSVAFSPVLPTGHYFVVGMGGESCTALLYSLDCGEPLRYFSKHLSSVSVVTFHPNGQYVATGCWDRAVRIFDLVDGMRVRVFTGHKAMISTLEFHPNEPYLLSGCVKGLLCLWDLAHGCLVAQMSHPAFSVTDGLGGESGTTGAEAGSNDAASVSEALNGTTSGKSKKAQKRQQRAAAAGGVGGAATRGSEGGLGTLQEKGASRRPPITALAFCRHGDVFCSGDLSGHLCWWNVRLIISKWLEKAAATATQAGFMENLNEETQARCMENVYPPLLLSETNQFLISQQRTRHTSIVALQFSRKNILYVAGDFKPPE